MTAADLDAVAAANAELYAAFEEGDLDRMEAVWDDGDDIQCIHPGWPLLRGRGRVLRSWSVIMANTNYIQFFLTGVEVSVDGDVAVHGVGGRRPPGPARGTWSARSPVTSRSSPARRTSSPAWPTRTVG